VVVSVGRISVRVFPTAEVRLSMNDDMGFCVAAEVAPESVVATAEVAPESVVATAEVAVSCVAVGDFSSVFEVVGSLAAVVALAAAEVAASLVAA